MRRALLLASLTLLANTARAQWQIQDAHITADLRGIDYVGNGVAWASGSNGTVLRTEDMGFVWQLCTTPPNAEHLDFRGIQAFDNNTAIVMSSGKGDQSRLYKTTDGCQTWKLIFTNPDKDGFWDALRADSSPQTTRDVGLILGDPVEGRFALFEFGKFGVGEVRRRPHARKGEACFAASNSTFFVWDGQLDFFLATGGKAGSRFVRVAHHEVDQFFSFVSYPSVAIPVGTYTESSGVFSLAPNVGAGRDPKIPQPYSTGKLVAVGGDYRRPDDYTRTAAYSLDNGDHWTAAQTPPHGYRSAVAYDPKSKTWITVGPNGTDISTDDGRNWRPLKPGPSDPPDADQHWNALSLPFVVGPHGRIGVLKADRLNHP